MQKYFSSALIVLTIVLTSAVITFAQVTGGAVTGSVVDSAGAVVPGVTVKITDKARGQEFTAQTTDAGSYLFPNVPVGEYTVSVERAGFAAINRDLNVSLNQTVTVDITLQVTGGTNVVDVVAGGEWLYRLTRRSSVEVLILVRFRIYRLTVTLII